jgi:hypothetical protein
LSKKRVLSGTVINNKKKCENCTRKDECTESNKMLTAYKILLDCEGFYYVFCEVEKIEQRPKLSDGLKKKYLNKCIVKRMMGQILFILERRKM